MNWLVKEEPSNYNFAALVRDGRTSWTGVRNPVAQKNLRSMKRGDRVFFYHRRREADRRHRESARRKAYPDPGDKTGALWAVDIAPAKPLANPVTLKAVKADSRFADFLLVRMSRLSVMPVTDDQTALEAMSR